MIKAEDLSGVSEMVVRASSGFPEIQRRNWRAERQFATAAGRASGACAAAAPRTDGCGFQRDEPRDQADSAWFAKLRSD